MKDPIDMPGKDVHRFYCINLATGHVRKDKVMTCAHAVQLNSYNHNKESGYQWLMNDQFDFNAQLKNGSVFVLKA